jgi:hypothetical protein
VVLRKYIFTKLGDIEEGAGGMLELNVVGEVYSFGDLLTNHTNGS